MNACVIMALLAKNINGHNPIKAILTGLNAPCSMGRKRILNNTSVKVAMNLSENTNRHEKDGEIIMH